MGWFPVVFVTAACACVAVCFAAAGADACVAVCFAYAAGGEVFEDWTVGYYSNFFEKDNDEQ